MVSSARTRTSISDNSEPCAWSWAWAWSSGIAALLDRPRWAHGHPRPEDSTTAVCGRCGGIPGTTGIIGTCCGGRGSFAAASIEARDRAVVGRGVIAEVEHHLVDIAPAPAVRRVVGFDDRMACRVKVLGGVAVRRVVATPDMAAGPAQPQMKPLRADLQTFLAAERARRHIANVVAMGAVFGHHRLLTLAGSAASSPASARNSCSAATTCAPSPTAAATRL